MLSSKVWIECPKCKNAKVIRIVYGYPTSREIHETCIHGGIDCIPSSPTHYCSVCGWKWRERSLAPIVYPFPTECAFCQDTLSDGDELVFTVAFVEWLESSQDEFRLTEELFDLDLFALCGSCRKGIQRNKEDIKQQIADEDKDRRKMVKVFTIAILIILAALLAPYWIRFWASR